MTRGGKGRNFHVQSVRRTAQGLSSNYRGRHQWRRKWQPILVFLFGKSHGQRSLVAHSPWGRKESDTLRLNNNKKAGVRESAETSMRGVNYAYLETDQERRTEKAMAPHSSTLAWKIPWAEEPGRLQSMGSQRVGHDWTTSLSLFTFMHWRRKWQPTPVFLPGESQGRWSLVGCRLWGRTESDTTEAT